MTRKGPSQKRFLILAIVAIVIVVAGGYYYTSSLQKTPSMTETGTETAMKIEQEATTTDYKLQLILGPPETMLTMDEAKTATEGEAMISGEMAMTMSGMTPNYHLEVHVTDIKTGAVITNATVTIQIINNSTKEVENIPVAVMYGVDIGKSDTHFGNNVTMMPGDYTIVVNVAGETATFRVSIPSMTSA